MMRQSPSDTTHQIKGVEDTDMGQTILKETDDYITSHMKWKKEHEIQNIKLMQELNKPHEQQPHNTATVPDNSEKIEKSKQVHLEFDTIMNQYQKDVDSVFKNKPNPEKVDVKNIKSTNIDYYKLKNDVEVSKYMDLNLSEIQKKLLTEDQMLKDLESMEVQLKSEDQQIDDIIGRMHSCHTDNASVTNSINREYDDINTILKKK